MQTLLITAIAAMFLLTGAYMAGCNSAFETNVTIEQRQDNKQKYEKTETEREQSPEEECVQSP